MTWWLWWLLDLWAGAGIGVWATLRLVLTASRMPYRWVCSAHRCRFDVSGTDPADVDQLATSHERSHQ